MVRDGFGDESGAKLIEQRGIDFAPSEDFYQTLKAAGASEAFLNALRAAKPPDARMSHGRTFMDDYSKSALGGRGREQQERMRVFLDCEKGPRDEAPYDFTKGRVKFEYKYSGLHKRNQHLKQKPHCAPIKTWSFQDLMGDGRRKTFDYLILEGNDRNRGPFILFSHRLRGTC